MWGIWNFWKKNGDFWRVRGESGKHIFDSINQNSLPRAHLFLVAVQMMLLRYTRTHKQERGEREEGRERVHSGKLCLNRNYFYGANQSIDFICPSYKTTRPDI